jgi:RHS repeat-associated protein
VSSTEGAGSSLPKGGGALSGIGETFQPDLHTGTGNLSVPIPLPPGRRGLAPSLALTYSSGSGNGAFGLGWAMSTPRIGRRTDRGIPQYRDSSDTFVLSGAEELVPVPLGSAAPAPNTFPDTATVTRYRPRTEAGFARIIHVTHTTADFWEVRSQDGLRSYYGTLASVAQPLTGPDPAVIVNPSGGVLSWLITETVDALGNRISYTYRPDPSGTQRYLSEVRYADYGDTVNPSYLVGARIVYQDEDSGGPAQRPDPFSDRRPGFELRSTLRAQRIEIWTHAPNPVLATTVDLGYLDQLGSAPSNAVSLLARIQVRGHDTTKTPDTQALPPLEFSYSDWDPASRRFQMLSEQLPPTPLGSAGLELVDLFCDGLPSLLQLNGAARYWRNRGGGAFAQPCSLASVPSGVSLAQSGTQLTDLNGDGRADLLTSTTMRTSAWSLAFPGTLIDGRAGFDPASYKTSTAPTFPLNDPQVRLFDLDGDHQLDLLRAGTPPMYALGDGTGGFTGLSPLPPGSELPVLDFTDPRMRLADMTADGLTDVVSLHNRSVTYWPNLGRGRFGPPVVMSGAPQFPDTSGFTATGFDPRRLLLGDVVGDGTADVIYVGDGQISVWVNQSGNGFAPPVVVHGTPRTSNRTTIRLADLNGAGVPGIIWSSVGPNARTAFLDLTGGTKPYLLTGIDNHTGASTALTYATSTTYATADRSAGNPWSTTLPFPVHVIATVSTRDDFAETELTAAFTYHNGYWDPGDREFRGFARVEQSDTLKATQPSPPAPAHIQPLDPLTRPTSLPTGLDASSAGNLLANWSYDTPAPEGGTSTLTTTADHPTANGPCGAASWHTFNNAATTTTTELVASTLPQGKGGSMIHVQTGAIGCGIAQTFASTGSTHVTSSAWIYVVQGTVAIATGDIGGAATDAVCTETGRWMLVQAGNQSSPANTLSIYSGSEGETEFYLDHAWTSTPLGPAEPIDSPPTRTITWFHSGPVGPPQGGWTELDLTSQYWSVDPPLTAHVDYGALAADLARPALREAVRALRGRVLRTETYADDGGPRALLPYEVHDFAYQVAPVLDGRLPTDPAWTAQPVVTVRPTLSRSAVWERGTEPMTRVQLSGGYDDYGRPHATVDVGVARGRDPRSPGAPCLATLSITEYATRDDASHYMIDRATRTAHFEATDDGTQPVVAFALATQNGTTPTDLRGLSLTFYDGAPFVGLDNGLIGEHGLPVRTEHLVITGDRLRQAFAPGPSGVGIAAPPYLTLDGTDGPSTWPADYPAAFQQSITQAPAARGPHLGFIWHPDGGGYTAGHYTQATRLTYDVHTGTGRGLVTVSRDAYGGDTTTTYNEYLLPTDVTDAAGLTTTTEYDYRILKPNLITDPNGNRTAAGYTQLGLPSSTARLGKTTAKEGDTPEQPSIHYEYDLTAWDDSASADPANPSPRQPMSVTTVRRIEHRWTFVAEENARRASTGQPPLTDAEIAALFGPDEQTIHPERFIRSVEFSDGFGRLLQTRTQADDLAIDDLGLPDDPTTPATMVTAHLAAAGAPAVNVSGWTLYDNKGRAVVGYEPFAGNGYSYVPPDDHLLAGLARTVRHYDPRGLCVRTVGPDGGETLTIPGIPTRITDPTNYQPTAWEAYVYDANDNAGRTHPTTTLDFANHWNTPASHSLDSFGRTIAAITRTSSAELITRTSYDIDGHPLTVTDPLGRLCADTVYDLTGQPWRSWLLDAGTTHTVRDATGAPVERRDDKAALTLTAYDLAHRPRYGWAADRSGTPTLRVVTVYGDDPADAGLSVDQALTLNARGRVVLTLDEAGQLVTGGYDIDGNPTSTTRRIIGPDTLLSTLPALPDPNAQWTQTSYQVDWQPTGTQTLTEHADTLLDTTNYRTDAVWDALARTTSQTLPSDTNGIRSQFTHTYGRGGGITSITLDGTPYLQTVSYDAHGRRQFAHLGNGLLIRYCYDPHTFRLARLHTAHATQPNPTTWKPDALPLQDHTYRYDPVGNLLTLADRTPKCGIPPGDADSLDRRLTYDPLYRLVTVTGRETDILPDDPWLETPRSQDETRARAYSETYDYDHAGNMVKLRHATDAAGTGAYTRDLTTVEGSNRLAALTTGAITASYSYDPCGNMTAETTSRLFEWDHANRLATFRVQAGNSEPSVYAQYRYDTSGNRVIKAVRKQNEPSVITIYLGPFERILLTTTAAGATTITMHDTLHVLDTARIATIQRNAVPDDPMPGQPIRYELGDHLRSSAVIVAVDATLLSREEYTPYGETSFGTYLRKRYRFTAKERDEESSLYYHGARYYAPWLARWNSCDPAVQHVAMSCYLYCRNGPLTATDPDGREDQATETTPVQAPTPRLSTILGGLSSFSFENLTNPEPAKASYQC